MPREATGQDQGRREAAAPNVTPPPGHPRFPRMDALRGIAVLSIICVHSRGSVGDGSWWIPEFSRLKWSVGLFFCVSGFVIFRPFAAAAQRQAPPIRIWAFYRRRVQRILPGFWFALAVLALLGQLFAFHAQDWWRYAGFLQIYDASTFNGGLGVTWTLAIEAVIYV